MLQLPEIFERQCSWLIDDIKRNVKMAEVSFEEIRVTEEEEKEYFTEREITNRLR